MREHSKQENPPGGGVLFDQFHRKNMQTKVFNRTKSRQMLWPRPRLNHPNFLPGEISF